MRTLALACLALAAGARPAAAEWFVTPFIGIKFGGDTNLVNLDQGAVNTKLTVGATGGFITDGLFGLEADFGYGPRFFESDGEGLISRSHVLTLMGNLIVAVPQHLTGLGLRPFVSGGAGLMRVGLTTLAGALDFDTNLFAINVGGGAIGPLTRRTSVRFELRYFKNVTEGEDALVVVPGPTHLSFWRTNVGITLR